MTVAGPALSLAIADKPRPPLVGSDKQRPVPTSNIMMTIMKLGQDTSASYWLRWLVLMLVLILPASAAAAAHHRCPPGSEWVKAHRNPVGHWIKGHCFITRPLSVPRHLPP
jgi:hypothetical protein